MVNIQEQYLLFLKVRNCDEFKCCECFFSERCIKGDCHHYKLGDTRRRIWLKKHIWNNQCVKSANSCNECVYQTECDNTVFTDAEDRREFVIDALMGVKKSA